MPEATQARQVHLLGQEGAFYGQEGRPQGSHPTKTYLKPVGAGLVPALVRDGFISFGIKNIPDYCLRYPKSMLTLPLQPASHASIFTRRASSPPSVREKEENP